MKNTNITSVYDPIRVKKTKERGGEKKTPKTSCDC